jgi:hypothetical protein
MTIVITQINIFIRTTQEALLLDHKTINKLNKDSYYACVHAWAHSNIMYLLWMGSNKTSNLYADLITWFNIILNILNIYIYICSNYLDLEKTRERISEFFTHADMNKLRCQYATWCNPSQERPTHTQKQM